MSLFTALPSTQKFRDLPYPCFLNFNNFRILNSGLGIDSDQYEEGLYEEPVPMDSNLSEGDSGYPTARMGAAVTSAAATFELESGKVIRLCFCLLWDYEHRVPLKEWDVLSQTNTSLRFSIVKLHLGWGLGFSTRGEFLDESSQSLSQNTWHKSLLSKFTYKYAKHFWFVVILFLHNN